MKTIYFVRHGETEGNTGNIFQGESTPLNEKGMHQAERVAERCSRIKIDAIISGALYRQQQTATTISEKIKMPFITSDLFDERRRPTSIVGRSRQDKQAVVVEEAWYRSIFEDGPRVEDGENFDDLKVRAGDALEFLASHSAESVLVVTSGNILHMLGARVIFGERFAQKEFSSLVHALYVTNSGLTLFRYIDDDPDRPSHPWRIATWNDHAHLG